MFKMIDKLRGAEAAARASALRRYAEILALGDAATPEQIGELQGLMKQLGFDTDRASADAKAISDRVHFVKTLRSLPEREKAKNATAAALNKHLDEMQATMQRLDNERARLLSARNAAEANFFAAARCERLLEELDRSHFELFGIPKPADPAPFGRSEPYRLPKPN
jgi:hypothetical protein